MPLSIAAVGWEIILSAIVKFDGLTFDMKTSGSDPNDVAMAEIARLYPLFKNLDVTRIKYCAELRLSKDYPVRRVCS